MGVSEEFVAVHHSSDLSEIGLSAMDHTAVTAPTPVARQDSIDGDVRVRPGPVIKICQGFLRLDTEGLKCGS